MSKFLTNFVCVKIYRYGEMPELTENLVYEMNENRIFVVPSGRACAYSQKITIRTKNE